MISLYAQDISMKLTIKVLMINNSCMLPFLFRINKLCFKLNKEVVLVKIIVYPYWLHLIHKME